MQAEGTAGGLRREKYFDGKRFVPPRLADDLMEMEHFITSRRSKIIYIYRDGVYDPEGEAYIDEWTRIILGDEYRKNRANEVISAIRSATYTEIIEPPPNLINLRNGIYDIETGKLYEHDPKYKFLNQLPVRYDPNASCQAVERFLREVVPGDEDVQTLLEWTGYCMYRDYPIQKALFLVGEGSNGKTTFLNLLIKFLGKENIASRPLQELVNNRFAPASLYGKLANICGDLTDEVLRRTGVFKMLTGGDPIETEKKFKDSFIFYNYAKLVFSANKLPPVLDDTTAFFRRVLPMVFPYYIPEERADPFLLDKLATPENLSGLFNIAIEALKGLLQRGRFTISPAIEEIRDHYARMSDPIKAFCQDCLKADPDGIIIKRELYALFCAYCRKLKLPPLSDKTFFSSIVKYFRVEETRIRDPKTGERARALKGISLTEEGVGLEAEYSPEFNFERLES